MTDTDGTASKSVFKDPINARKYALARQFGDANVAIGVIYDELARDPENYDLMDSLATLYFQSRAYGQSLSLARIILTKRPADNRMLELLAISQQNIGQVKEALATYEDLYLRTKSIYHLYQVCVLQYQLTRLAECAGTLNQLIGHKEAEEARVFVPVNQQQGQNILVKAAAYNILGVLQRDQSQLPAAKQSFEAALKLEPEFLLAKNNLEQVNKAIAGGN